MYFAASRHRWVAPGAAAAWDGVATPGEIGRPGDLPVPVGQQLRRWGALLALAGLALPGVIATRAAERRPAVPVSVVDASRSETPGGAGASPGDGAASGLVAPGGLPSGDAGDDTAPAAATPW
ncbi:MAG TPA: hypothetical protein VGR20_07850, partial [Acidimicrobiia bacterium]|nr:hypothetical protein [Acidimicrobiia bacterium]